MTQKIELTMQVASPLQANGGKFTGFGAALKAVAEAYGPHYPGRM